MFDKEKLKLSDIKSKTTPSVEYVTTIDIYKGGFEKYRPNLEVVNKIIDFLDKKEEIITIVAFGASWCKDCVKNLPELAKIDSIAKDERLKIDVLGNIKVKAPYAREKGKVIWIVPPSPPEVIDEKFDMFHIPAMYIFNKAGDCLGKIDENPEHKDTLEEEILYYLE
ncbi:MAG: TlpA family protein disulfide reductase [Promethearchaeota archaeon]